MTDTARAHRGAIDRAGRSRDDGHDDGRDEGHHPDRDREVVLRPVTAEDREGVGALYRGLSPRARFLRFGSGTPPPSGALLDAIVAVDGRDRVAVGAFLGASGAQAPGRSGDDCVGEARLHRVRRGVVEVAVTVAEGWRRRGLGHRLLAAGLHLAAARGEHEVLVAVHPENRAALGLVRRTVDAPFRDAGGLLEARVAFPLPTSVTAAAGAAGEGPSGR